MEDRLQEDCNAILNDQSLPEEDRIEAVEEHVRGKVQNMQDAEIERLVLDILWAHREGRKAVRKLKIVSSTASNPIQLPEAAYKVEARKPAKAKKQKWVSLDDLEPSTPETPEPPAPQTPHDLLRNVLGQNASDEDIERLLAHNEFDIGRTIDMLTGSSSRLGTEEQLLTREKTSERIMCRYFLQTGSCFRGNDCMFSHDVAQRICRFWLQGKCMAGDDCAFLHYVPEEILEKLSLNEPKATRTPTVLDKKSLPALGSKKARKKPAAPAGPGILSSQSTGQSIGQTTTQGTSAQGFDLDKAVEKAVSQTASPLASLNRGLLPVRAPMRTPWKHPGFLNNQEYIDHRTEARKWSELRNKYLQLATDSWSNNDPASAKAFSKKGQDFNFKMELEYEKARKVLEDQQKLPSSEIFVDIHGLELGAAVDHVEHVLLTMEEHERHSPRLVYVICGRGHYKVKRHADQLTQQVKVFLDEFGYIYKDFGDDQTFGRIIGIDPFSAIKK